MSQLKLAAKRKNRRTWRASDVVSPATMRLMYDEGQGLIAQHGGAVQTKVEEEDDSRDKAAAERAARAAAMGDRAHILAEPTDAAPTLALLRAGGWTARPAERDPRRLIRAEAVSRISSRGKPLDRELYLFNNNLVVTKAGGRFKTALPTSTLLVRDVEYDGRVGEFVFQVEDNTDAKNPTVLVFDAPSAAAKAAWIEALSGRGGAARGDRTKSYAALALRARENPRVWMDISIGGLPLPRLEIELFANIVPRTAENFRQLCALAPGERAPNGALGYAGNRFHRVESDFCAQVGDTTEGDGTGGMSIYGETFADENFRLLHDETGLLSMANCGPNTNGSQFFILLCDAPWLDGKHTVFGKVTKGLLGLSKLNAAGTEDGVPREEVRVKACGEVAPDEREQRPTPMLSAKNEKRMSIYGEGRVAAFRDMFGGQAKDRPVPVPRGGKALEADRRKAAPVPVPTKPVKPTKPTKPVKKTVVIAKETPKAEKTAEVAKETKETTKDALEQRKQALADKIAEANKSNESQALVDKPSKVRLLSEPDDMAKVRKAFSPGPRASYVPPPPPGGYANPDDDDLRAESDDDEPQATVARSAKSVRWVPDKAARKCMLCESKFTMMSRRHHCRACGIVVCNACSTHRVAMNVLFPDEADAGTEKVRTCDACFEALK